MELAGDKENVAPFTSSDPLQRLKSSSPAKKASSKKGRSKSIGPGDLAGSDGPSKQDAKNRRKSTYVPATKSIISSDVEKAERQAARRRTLANRRVSFAPEATLHTWDVIEFMRDHTTSTESSDTTRCASSVTGSSITNGKSPTKRSPLLSSEIDEPSPSSSEQDEEPEDRSTPSHATRKKQSRRSSGIPPMNFNNPEDAYSSSGISGSSDASGSEEEDEQSEEDDVSEDATGTAMSLDMGEDTIQSGESTSSTSSSARLDAALRQAAELAGTRGIEYDEHGDDVSMEIAGEEITNAFKAWSEEVINEPLGSAALDQENVNPFSPAFKAQVVSGVANGRPETEDEETGDMSMDVTRAVGGILKARSLQDANSPMEDGTMEMTRAFGRVQDNAHGSPAGRLGQKRRRSTTEAGSPGVTDSTVHYKRRRSSVARSSMGDDSMDLTVAVGGIQDTGSPVKSGRRKSVARRRSSGAVSEQDEATMEMTQAFGAVKNTARHDQTSFSFDENEELTMELTTVLGGVNAAESAIVVDRPATPQTAQSPLKAAMNTTLKDQERYLDAPDSGPGKLLTPIFQKQRALSIEKLHSSIEKRSSRSPSMKLESPQRSTEHTVTKKVKQNPTSITMPKSSPSKGVVASPSLPSSERRHSPARLTPVQNLRQAGNPVPVDGHQEQLNAQLSTSQQSPLVEKHQRSTPSRASVTPEQARDSRETPSIVNSIKLLATPRKETLKAVTPKKHTPVKQQSPVKATPRARPTPKSKLDTKSSPAKRLVEDLLDFAATNQPVQKVHLQQFLDMAGIRFMDLTATKRRLTTAPTPSKAWRETLEQDSETSLETAVVAAACTQPEHDMYQHACHELKHYISEGKKVIKKLEAETYREQPPLVQAYMHATGERKAVLDAHMREMKTQARHRSKEMWYAWRSQLLEDLMKALSSIGEGLIADDDTLRRAEETVERVLPTLLQQREELHLDAEQLERDVASSAATDEEREELATARERLVEVDLKLEEKRRLLETLQQEAQQLESEEGDLQDNKLEFAAAIQEAERVREACRGISLDEITALQDSIKHLEEITHWSIASASSSPTTVTLSYKNQLQLFFHPSAFNASPEPRSNAPISLTYTGTTQSSKQPGGLSTTLRFFLQLLRAALQALPQHSTRIPQLLQLVSSSWDVALAIEESTRRLHLETPTTSRIVDDERLAVEAAILLPKVRTKVLVRYEVRAAVGGDGAVLSTTVTPNAKVAYGEAYGEEKMTRFVKERIEGSGGMEGWDKGVRELREKLVAQGGKGGLRR